jgi:hypothetical protein
MASHLEWTEGNCRNNPRHTGEGRKYRVPRFTLWAFASDRSSFRKSRESFDYRGAVISLPQRFCEIYFCALPSSGGPAQGATQREDHNKCAL